MSSNNKEHAPTSQNNRTDLENSRPICDRQPHPDSQSNCSTFAEPIKQTGLANPEKDIKHETEENTITAHITSQASPNKQPHLASPAPNKEDNNTDSDQNPKESSYKHNEHFTKNPHPDEEAGLNSENHYDAGWGWVVCGTTFLVDFLVGGMITSSGVILLLYLLNSKNQELKQV